MNSLFIYEELFYPYDEGMKKFSYKIFQNIEQRMRVKAIKDIRALPSGLNSLLIAPRIILASLFRRPDFIVYIPKQSLTFFSLIKAWLIYLFVGERLRVVGLQKRDIGKGKARLLKKLEFGKVYVLSHAMRRDLEQLNIHADVIYTGIDTNRFQPAANKAALRAKYGVPENRTILLHVGHIKLSRNLELLIDLNRRLDNCQVVIVGSTATVQERLVQKMCTDAGVIVFNENIDDIHELYGLSDIYCFPVKNDNGAMETPLSVLEAMSVDLPVITTRFGQLTELFSEDNAFLFIDSADDVNDETINQLLSQKTSNRKKIEGFTWDATTRKILSA
jgi:glycosyltransferase involved in cell wall biosynthesis